MFQGKRDGNAPVNQSLELGVLIIVLNKNGLESLRDHDVAQELTLNSWIVLISVGCRVAVCWPMKIHNNVRLNVLKQSGLVYRDGLPKD
jgi:hypothetical protein